MFFKNRAKVVAHIKAIDPLWPLAFSVKYRNTERPERISVSSKDGKFQIMWVTDLKIPEPVTIRTYDTAEEAARRLKFKPDDIISAPSWSATVPAFCDALRYYAEPRSIRTVKKFAKAVLTSACTAARRSVR